MIFKGDGQIEESHQQYSEYLELEHELAELAEMEKESAKEKPVERVKQKELKLTFKEKIALEKLPIEIEKLEKLIDEKNGCLSNPACYEKIGITVLAEELQKLKESYEQKVDELLTIEEKAEEIASL